MPLEGTGAEMRRLSELRVKEVRKVFGRQVALGGVSFAVQPGRIALLVGPNGAGKSTLLAILSTLSRPSSGEVRYGEHDHAYAERHLRGRIGLLAHTPMLYERMTGRENLLFFARMYGVPEAAAAVSRTLTRVGMEDAADRPVSQLSRGMAQRLALARALLSDPDLLLLDEPFTGLDREAVGLLRDELEAARAGGRLVLVVTHDLEAVDGLCGHLLVLREGRLAVEQAESALSSQRILELYHGPA
jgi:heme exporter protein A